MAAITYTAVDRGTLNTTVSPAHTEGTEYSIDVKLQAYSTGIDQPKTQHVSIGGSVETVLMRATKVHSIILIWPDTSNADMEEFLFSVAAGEIFSFSPYGDVGDSPDVSFQVVSVDGNLSINRMTHGSAPWRSVNMTLRPV